MIFVPNITLSRNGWNCYGSGPIRLIETEDSYKLVVVNETSVIATLIEFKKSAVVGDEDVPIIMVKDERI